MPTPAYTNDDVPMMTVGTDYADNIFSCASRRHLVYIP
jgi:hypothetical protein